MPPIALNPEGVPVLLDALAEARQTRPDLTLTLVGDGPDRAALEADMQARGLRGAVQFLGYKSQSEVAELLAFHDGLVLPSLAEGVPVVLMEAMAASMPTIATAVGGVSELVEDGVTGCLVAPGDGAALRDAILRVAGDSALRQRMGEAGRAKVEADFTATTEAARLARLFRAGPDLPAEKRPELQR